MPKNDYFERMNEIENHIQNALKQRFIDYGHYLTGGFIDAIKYKETKTGDSTIIEASGPIELIYLDKGTPKGNIPYSPGTKTGAKKSQYIEGLTEYAKKRFSLADKEAKQVAFAIANKHSKEGNPSFGSFKHSKFHKRTGFLTDTLSAERQTISNIFFKQYSNAVSVQFSNLVRKYDKELTK